MVNEKQGKVYAPKAVYDRKIMRSIIRKGCEKKFGRSKVSRNMSANFKRLRKEKGEE